MLILSLRRAVYVVAILGVMAAAVQASAETRAAFSKDTGPSSSGCDRFEKASAAWSGCVGQAKAAMPSNEAFYAGYWLAKAGHYEDALTYLKQASAQDERVLTYIGYATRKLGDVDGALPFYNKALALNPNYAVARAYLGDAYLTKGEPGKAKGQLAEIERRCGQSCAEYADLAHHIDAYENQAKSVVR
jgi:tetratricopeptide (TPR) repeat protein